MPFNADINRLQEPNRNPAGAQQEPSRNPAGAQQEPNRNPAGAQQEPSRRLTCFPRQSASFSRSYTLWAFSLCPATWASWPDSTKYGRMLTMSLGKQSASSSRQSFPSRPPMDLTCSKSSRKIRWGISTWQEELKRGGNTAVHGGMLFKLWDMMVTYADGCCWQPESRSPIKVEAQINI